MSDTEDPSSNERNLTVLWEKPKKARKVALEKPKKKRVCTTDDEWTNMLAKFKDISDIDVIEILENTPENAKILVSHIRSKIHGYASQDRNKGLYDADKFVCFQEVVELLKSSSVECFYCHERVLLLYTFVRDTKQWTLERKDNSLGHNRDNVVLACLSCNVKRKCMKMERYILTKQLDHIEKLD